MSVRLISALDWFIAWRHLRVGDERPPWVMPLIMGAVYLIAMGGGFAMYASGLGGEGGGFDPFGAGSDMGPTALQRYYGAFGGLTLILGVMTLVFGLLSFFFNLLPTIITMSVLLGTMALVVVLSLMSGLEGDLRDKILNQKAHIRIASKDGRPFADYLELTDAVNALPEVAGASPFIEGEIIVRSGLNRQGALLIGIMPDRQLGASNLAGIVEEGKYEYLSSPESIPDPDPFTLGEVPWRLRHLDRSRKGRAKEDRADEPKRAVAGVEVADEQPPRAAAPTKAAPDDDADGWEDPAVELPRLRRAGRVPPAIEGAPPGAPDDDGWEDPERLLPTLRDQGRVPDAREPDVPREPDAERAGPLLEDGDGAGPTPGAVGPAHDAPARGVPPPVLIGRELTMELGVQVGAQMRLVTPTMRMTPAGYLPGMLAVKVAGVFYSGMYEYDRKNAYAPLEVVQRFLRAGDRVSGIEIKLVDVEQIDEGKAAVERVVGGLARDGEILVEDWRDLNRNLFSAMFLEKVAMFIALLFVVLVASFGILASNLMSVMEKSREIAVLKAMGSTDRGILRVFVAEGLCVGLVGSFAGIAMGLVLCWALDRFGFPLNENVYYIEKLPVVVSPTEVLLVGIAALVIVWLSSLYPALIASRMRPVDALRQVDR